MNRLFSNHMLSGMTAIAVTGLLLLAAAPAVAAEEQSGTIQSASETELVLRVGTESVRYQVNGQTSVTLNGNPAETGELKAGDSATVSFSLSDDGEKTATTIEAKREEAPEQS